MDTKNKFKDNKYLWKERPLSKEFLFYAASDVY